MLRRRGPVPYELIGRTRGLPAKGGEGVSTSFVEPMPIGPGRALRVPAGYLLVAGTVVCALLVAAFAWGFSRGEAQARSEAARTLAAAVTARSVRDPLESRNAGPAPARSDETGSAPGSPADTTIGGDPRRAGLNYFVVAHGSPESAPELASFCRDRGLEAAVVSDHNGVLRKVIVTPGYADGDRRSSQVQTLERQIRDVGLAWKSHRRGNADFSGAYPELFRGSASE